MMLTRSAFKRLFGEISHQWPQMTLYQRFERVTAILLTVAISAVVVFALFYLLIAVFSLLVLRPGDPFDYRAFQAVFGMVMTVLIALEFNHSIIQAMERRDSIINVNIVVLIAILALVRKFIVMDVEDVEAPVVAALAFAVLAMGGVYWLVRDRDDRSQAMQSELAPPGDNNTFTSGR